MKLDKICKFLSAILVRTDVLLRETEWSDGHYFVLSRSDVV